MSDFICPHGSPVRPSGEFTDDQCYRCWRAATGRTRGVPAGLPAPSPPRGVCEYLGERVEERPGCNGRMCLHVCEAGEPGAVPGGVCQTCPKWIPRYSLDAPAEPPEPPGHRIAIGDPPAVNPTRPRLVCTVAVGDHGAEMLAATGPFLRRYAGRVGADFLAITGDPLNAGYPLADKFRLHHLTPHWDRILFVDADAVVHPSAPDLFDLVPAGVGVRDDAAEVEHPGFMETAYRTVLASQGESGPPSGGVVFNSGVVVWGRGTPGVWEPPARPFPLNTHVAEQCWVQRNVFAAGYPVSWLGRGWNYQWWADRPLSGIGPDTHILHLAGMSQMDGVTGWRVSPPELRAAVLRAVAWAAG